MNSNARQSHRSEHDHNADEHHPLRPKLLVKPGADEHASRGSDGQNTKVRAALRHLRGNRNILVKLDHSYGNQRNQRHKDVRKERHQH